MIRVTIVGTGNVGHALAGLLGARPELDVVWWGRSHRQAANRTVRVFGNRSTYGIGAVVIEPSLIHAVDGADVVILTVPAHVRHRILTRIRRRLDSCGLLLAWEGMGGFAESLREIGIDTRIAAGLQRSPIFCRTREPYRSVEILGVRSQVIAASVEPARVRHIEQLVTHLLPFRFAFVGNYAYAALSPSNPLIHPARLYASDVGGTVRPGSRFYTDWDQTASSVLLELHRELAGLRDAVGLRADCLRTLVDGARPCSPRKLTRDTRSARRLSEILLPVIVRSQHAILDIGHRFFMEDIGEGLAYMVAVARAHGRTVPMAETICRWHKGLQARQA